MSEQIRVGLHIRKLGFELLNGELRRPQIMPMDLIRAGIGRDRAYALMKGEHRDLKLSELVIIADLMECTVKDLFSVAVGVQTDAE